MKKLIFFTTLLLLLSQTKSFAATMGNSNWVLRGGNFGEAKKNDFKKETKDIDSKNSLGGGNYKVNTKSGNSDTQTLRFTVSSLAVNFGTLTPGDPISRSLNFTILNKTPYGYQVSAIQDHPLRIPSSGFDIPDTTCDEGTCTETTSSVWESPLVYGLGYRCDDIKGFNCIQGFEKANLYKQFANKEAGEKNQIIMTGIGGKTKQTKVTLKVNVAQTQAAGTYQNTIMYIATPTL